MTGPAFEAAQGMPRLRALCEAYISYVERGVFPGGCFFASLLAEMDARPGTLHELVVEGTRARMETIVELARDAQRRGEIAEDVELDELAFELQAVLELANYHFVLFRDSEMLELGRRAIVRVLERAAGKH